MSPPTPQIFATAGGQSRTGHQIILDGFLEQTSTLKQATAAASRRVPTFQREFRIDRGEQRDVFDRVLDVEVFESGDVEICRVKMRFNEAGMIVPPRASIRLRRANFAQASGWTCVGDATIADDQSGIADRRLASAVDQRAVTDDGRPVASLWSSFLRS